MNDIDEFEEDKDFFPPFNSLITLIGASQAGKTVFATSLLTNYQECFRRAPERIYRLVIMVTGEQKNYDAVERALKPEHVVRTTELTQEMGEAGYWSRPGYDFDGDNDEDSPPRWGSVLWMDDMVDTGGNIHGPALQVIRDAHIHHANLLVLAGVHDSTSGGRSDAERMVRNNADIYVIFFRGLTSQSRSNLQRKFFTADHGLLNEAVDLCHREGRRYLVIDTVCGRKNLKVGLLPDEVGGYVL